MNELEQDALYAPNPLSETTFPFLISNTMNRTLFPKRFEFEAIHWHDDLQFIIVNKGSITIQTLKSQYVVNEGSVVYINKKVIHRISKQPNANCQSYIFPDTLLVSSNKTLHQQLVTSYTQNSNIDIEIFNLTPSVYQSVKQLHDEVNHKEKSLTYELDVISTLHKIWSHFITAINAPKQVVSKMDTVRQERLKNALNFMHNHYHESISLDDIAQSCHIGKSELLRLFRNTIEISPYDYLIDFRINKSIELLNQTDLAISIIATEVGYNSQSQFGKHFKQRLGISPNAYRHQNIQ